MGSKGGAVVVLPCMARMSCAHFLGEGRASLFFAFSEKLGMVCAMRGVGHVVCFLAYTRVYVPMSTWVQVW